MGLLQKERVLTYPDTPKTILSQRSAYKLTAELPPMEYAPQHTLSDINMKTESKLASSKEFKEISKMLSQGDEKSIQTIKKDFNKVIAGKEEEISCLRDHNQKLLLQIKKMKYKTQYNQKLDKENQDL